MLISPPLVTDTVYQTIQELLKQHGIEELEPLQQSVLLEDSAFYGYRFQGKQVQIDWIAQDKVILIKNHAKELIVKHKILPQNSLSGVFSSSEGPDFAAA